MWAAGLVTAVYSGVYSDLSWRVCGRVGDGGLHRARLPGRVSPRHPPPLPPLEGASLQAPPHPPLLPLVPASSCRPAPAPLNAPSPPSLTRSAGSAARAPHSQPQTRCGCSAPRIHRRRRLVRRGRSAAPAAGRPGPGSGGDPGLRPPPAPRHSPRPCRAARRLGVAAARICGQPGVGHQQRGLFNKATRDKDQCLS